MSDEERRRWLAGAITNVCRPADEEEDLLGIVANARTAGLRVHAVRDAGRTEFLGGRTLTCCASGPDDADQIDAITGHLRAL